MESHELLQHLFYSLSRRENLSHILFFSTCTSCDKEGSTRHSRFFLFFFPLPCLSHMIFWLNCLSLPASTSVLSPTVYVALLSGRLYVRKCLFSLATSTAKNIFSPIEQRGEKTGGRELMRKRKEELFYIKQAREAQACGLRAFVETLGG